MSALFATEVEWKEVGLNDTDVHTCVGRYIDANEFPQCALIDVIVSYQACFLTMAATIGEDGPETESTSLLQ